MSVSLKRTLLLFLIPVVLAFGTTSICLANSGPPPAIFIIVTNAPKDLVLKVDSLDLTRKDKIFESYFGFFLHEHKIPTETNLQITTRNSTHQIPLPPLKSYFSTFTLDLRNNTLTPGAPPFRAYEFAAVTVVLTLLIEGIIFYLFGYRKKSSWIVFLVTNLITQGFLYIWLNNTVYPSFQNYVVLNLILGEFWVFIIEIITFLVSITERRRLETFLFVIMANLISLFAGGWLVSALI